MNCDYPIDALSILLKRECVCERYYPLIPRLPEVLTGLHQRGIERKSGAEGLPDAALAEMGLNEPGLIALFRRFLSLYDPNPKKLREAETLSEDPDERAAFRELYCLPGVRATRAKLYYAAGYRSLASLADADEAQVLEATARTIAERMPECAPPLPKEVRTHIAVARAFTMA